MAMSHYIEYLESEIHKESKIIIHLSRVFISKRNANFRFRRKQ